MYALASVGVMLIRFSTALWEELTETNFSVANIIAIPIAVFLNIYTVTLHDKLPFDIWTPPKDCLPDPASIVFPKWNLAGGEGSITAAPSEDAVRCFRFVSFHSLMIIISIASPCENDIHLAK